MKNIYLIILAIVVIGGVLFFAVPSEKETYVREITSEIDALEAELQSLESEIDFETLTPEVAVEKQAVIVEKLTRIQALVDTAPKDSLSKEKYAELQRSLQRLASSLSEYSDSLTQLDSVAENASSAVKERVFGRTYKGLNHVVHKIAADALEVVEEHLEDISDEPIAEEVVEVVDEATDTLDEVIEEMINEDEEIMGDDEEMGGAAGTMPEGTEGEWNDTPMNGDSSSEEELQ